MDDKSLELAKQDLDATHAALVPEYQRLDEALSAELAINRSKDQEQIDARNNAELLGRLTDLLPKAREISPGNRSIIEVSSPLEMRAIQSSVIWLRAWSGGTAFVGSFAAGFVMPMADYAVRPYWVLGEAYKSRTQKEFLLMPAIGQDHYSGSITSPTQRFLERTNSGLLVLTPSQRDQDRISSLPSTLFDLPLQESERYPAQINHKSPGAEVLSYYARVALHRVKSTPGVTDHELAKYDVFKHVNRLASLFGKKDEFAALLANYPENPTT